jgi:hypothetical protein
MPVTISWLKIRISINITVEFGDVNISDSETEFYTGAFAQIEISEKFASQHQIMCWLVNDFDDKSNVFNVVLQVGYFLTNDLAIGGIWYFNTFKDEVSGVDVLDQSVFGVGAFARYYFWDLGERSKTFTEFGVGYSSAKDQIFNVAFNTIDAGLDLGINYLVQKKLL